MRFPILLAVAATATLPLVAAQNTGLLLVNGVDAYIDVPYAPTLLPRSGITVEAWITYDESTLGGGNRWPTVVRQNSSPGLESFMLRVNAGSNNTLSLGWMVRTGLGSRTASWTFNPMQLNVWTHVAGTYDGAMVRLYVNGVEVAAIAGSGVIVDVGNSFRIGNGDLSSPGAEEWNGNIDEVRLWPFARTAAEILSTMNFELSTVPGEVSTWNLNNNGNDTSGGNHGQLVNNPTFASNSLPLQPIPLGAMNFGTATAGCSGAPRAVLTTFAQVGSQNFAVGTIRSTATGSGILWLGANRLNAPIRLFGVDLWIDPLTPSVQVPIPGGLLGYSRVPLPIPTSRFLGNRQLSFQTIWAEPGCASVLFASDGAIFTIAP